MVNRSSSSGHVMPRRLVRLDAVQEPDKPTESCSRPRPNTSVTAVVVAVPGELGSMNGMFTPKVLASCCCTTLRRYK